MDFTKTNTSKISLHHFENSHLKNGDESFALYIAGEMFRFPETIRFMGTKKAIMTSMYRKFEGKVYNKYKRVLNGFIKKYPSDNIHMYYDEKRDFVFLVTEYQDGFVVSLKLGNARTAPYVDYFSNTIETRTGENGDYNVHSMSITPGVKSVDTGLTGMGLINGMMDILIGTGKSFSDIRDVLKMVEAGMAMSVEKPFGTEINEDTLILTVGESYCGGKITTQLMNALRRSYGNDVERPADFANECGIHSHPNREMFRGNIWIIDVDCPVQKGYPYYEKDSAAHRQYKNKKGLTESQTF